jgi:hypothetical protein
LTAGRPTRRCSRRGACSRRSRCVVASEQQHSGLGCRRRRCRGAERLVGRVARV